MSSYCNQLPGNGGCSPGGNPAPHPRTGYGVGLGYRERRTSHRAVGLDEPLTGGAVILYPLSRRPVSRMTAPGETDQKLPLGRASNPPTGFPLKPVGNLLEPTGRTASGAMPGHPARGYRPVAEIRANQPCNRLRGL